ncbi:hypothetical protein A33Y_0162 [Candidatus Carsonella ruddii CS isolate Thao2000]|uniref:Uncharacterized protein n=1 Tax=Candidatus Carsonella ruddii CS isolate Thao2000 TaxID=1202537 RepID=J7GTE1_CARRU|nr:hypothetical protein [Candidatus Carsonella ruddii]AFP83799.1 hypothetical protein A33Y_0162 [Candidatus Carsonella ruddii CS isolate Thao2000]
MIKNLIFLFNNKINYVSNFYNYLIQINIKINLLKIDLLFNFINIKILILEEKFYKINQFLKLSKKCFNIRKIFSYKNFKLILFINFFFKIKIKYLKKFIFIIKKKNFFIFFYNKKNYYVKSILNNFFINKNLKNIIY